MSAIDPAVGISDFQFTPEDAFAYWQASIEHAYRAAKGQRAQQLRGERPKTYDSEHLHTVSAAMGRARAMEMLIPDLTLLWHVGGRTPSDFVPCVRLVEEAAREDADAEWLEKKLATREAAAA